jgi:glyoxylase-like metal-dependent hydrolase (beta-lactamase superfamily II)
MKIFRFVFNNILVNTYLLVASDGETILIDPACGNPKECDHLEKIIKKHKMHVAMVIATHSHADHVMGIKMVMDICPDASFLMHQNAYGLYKTTNDYSLLMGFTKTELPVPSDFLQGGETLRISDIELEVLSTPGHAQGSISLYNKESNSLFTGDVLFRDSIGRTDLPGGDFIVLRESIYEKLFTLPPDTVVFPGHGDSTTIGYEKENNLFLN